MRHSIVLFLTSLLSCTNQKSSDVLKTESLKIRIEAEPPTLDWTLVTDALSRDVIINLQVGLARLANDSSLVPELAESWTVSPDGKKYTFKLRKDAKWSDGQAVKAQHFLDSIERALNPKTGAENSYLIFSIKNAENYLKGATKNFSEVGVSAPDDLTVIYELSDAAPFWLNIPAFIMLAPIRKELIEKYGNRWTDPENLITTGPYTLASWERESKLVLKKNPHYWNEETRKNSIDNVEFRVVKENSIAVALFDRKEVNVVGKLPPLQVPMLEKSNAAFKKFPQMRSFAVAFGVKNPATSNVKTRKALSLAIDRSQIAKFLSGSAEATNSWVPQGMLGSNEENGLNFNPEEAKKIWAEIKPTPSNLEFWFPNDEKTKLLAEFLQSEWKKNLGVEVKLSAQDWKVFLKTSSDQNLPLFRHGWGAAYLDTSNFLDMFTCNSGLNKQKYCNKNYDKLIRKAYNSFDKTTRANAYAAAEKILLQDDVVIAPLFHENAVYLVDPKLKGFEVNTMGEFRLADVRF